MRQTLSDVHTAVSCRQSTCTVPALPRASDPRAEPAHRSARRVRALRYSKDSRRPLTQPPAQPTKVSTARRAAVKQSCAVTPDGSEAFLRISGPGRQAQRCPAAPDARPPAAPTHTAPVSRRDRAPDSSVRRSPATRARGPRAARQERFLEGEEGEAAPRPPPLRPGCSRGAALCGPGRGPSARLRARDRPRERQRCPTLQAGRSGLPAVRRGTAPRRPHPRHGGTARPGAARGAEPGQRPVGDRGPTGPQDPRPPPSPSGRGSPRCPPRGSPRSARRPWRRRPHKARRHGRGTRSRPPRQGRGRPRAGHAGTPRCGAPCRSRTAAGSDVVRQPAEAIQPREAAAKAAR